MSASSLETYWDADHAGAASSQEHLMAWRAKAEQLAIDSECSHTEGVLASERGGPCYVPLCADDRVPLHPHPQRDRKSRASRVRDVRDEGELLGRAAELRETAAKTVAACADQRAHDGDTVGLSMLLVDCAHALKSEALRLRTTSLTGRRERQLTRERIERDRRGRTRYGLVLTPTMLLDLADELERLGFTELSWHFRAAASGFLPFAPGDGTRPLPCA